MSDRNGFLDRVLSDVSMSLPFYGRDLEWSCNASWVSMSNTMLLGVKFTYEVFVVEIDITTIRNRYVFGTCQNLSHKVREMIFELDMTSGESEWM